VTLFLVVTIDVEPDCTPTWRYSIPLTFKGVSIGVKEILQPLFNKYKIKPTYLINNVVLENEESIEVFRRLDGEFELGTHLHPEFIEPEKKYFDYAAKKGEANCCFYPEVIEFQKIKNITELFQSKFGYTPISFRAGRFSAGNNTMQSLIRLGYKVDTSVTPHICWEDKSRESPVDFREAPEQPYFVGKNILQQSISRELLQVPVSIARLNSNIISDFFKSGFGLRRKVRYYKSQWLRPVYSNLGELKKVVEYYRSKYASNDLIVLNMMFHNVEVLSGLSPYATSEQHVRTYLKTLEDFFIYCNKQKIEGKTLRDVYKLYA
jgi:hypothetical protein